MCSKYQTPAQAEGEDEEDWAESLALVTPVLLTVAPAGQRREVRERGKGEEYHLQTVTIFPVLDLLPVLQVSPTFSPTQVRARK